MTGVHRKSYKDLILWQKAVALATEIHRLTGKIPRHELFGIISQIRRAAVSVPSNIAEGSARRSTREFMAFLHIARGSLAELETQLLLSEKIGYLREADLLPVWPQLAEVGRLLTAVIQGLRRRESRSPLSPTP